MIGCNVIIEFNFNMDVVKPYKVLRVLHVHSYYYYILQHMKAASCVN